jgi:hyperosmotically inducible periplasmic protein
MRVLKCFSIALLAFAVLCWPSLAGAALHKGHVALSDSQIKANVEHKLSELELSSSRVTVSVQDGVVTLSGTVPSLWLKQEAINRARKTDDVKSVVPDIAVMRGESDEILANEIAKRVRQYVFYTIYDDVEGSVHDGVVTLTGKVTMPSKASEIGDLVARVQGVREVENKISTLPVSTFDDQLRVTIASQIYRDPLFWNYAIQVNPPIHVVVDHGHVTLTGVVNSEVERRKAETIARTTFGAFSVDNKLRLDREMRSTQ